MTASWLKAGNCSFIRGGEGKGWEKKPLPGGSAPVRNLLREILRALQDFPTWPVARTLPRFTNVTRFARFGQANQFLLVG
jgi:hypothetical protein